MNASVKCLYYPYSRALSLQTLKKSVLLFDEIAFLDSESTLIRKELMSELIYGEELEEIEETYDFLIKENVVKIIQSAELIKNNDELLSFSVLNDVLDDSFIKIALGGYSSNFWAVIKDRIPPSFFKEITSMFKEDEAELFMALNSASTTTTKKLFNVEKSTGNQLIPEVLRYIIFENTRMGKDICEVPFPLASSLRINECLLLSSMNGYTPFTDSKIHDRMLLNKASRAMNEVKSNHILLEYLDFDLPRELPFQQLSHIVLDKLIPESELEKRSIEELIAYRKENINELYRLREKIAEISSTIILSESTNDYYRELDKAVISKIIPEITKTRDEILKKYEEAFGRLTLRSIQSVGSTLTATSLAGMSFFDILIACAVAEGAMLTTVGANELVKIWQACKDKKRNSYSYLTNFK
ncbi:Uncharacterized protein BCZB5J_02712 [Bacillus cereus]|nr:Uncharacterized protein BCZB5J_02712 [Bacillus cereus]